MKFVEKTNVVTGGWISGLVCGGEVAEARGKRIKRESFKF